MHEVGIISAMLKKLERVMEEEGLTHVEKVVLEVGELSGIIPRYMEECFPAAIYKTEFEDLHMEMEVIPGIVMCLECRHEYRISFDRMSCPVCGSNQITPVSGNGFVIKEIYAS
ncbi:hydrogenase maturation nickel metallochaperone HypA [Enterocloster asparagiformis]|uniref:hydrogenase maturation nickel metallochaperone HypA n=1 Tax=Enterocloster asparagiformis TaxID=333367 RepID=UPI0023570B54